jgi:hypothetical protein
VNSLAELVSPPTASVLVPWILIPAFVGELALALWLARREGYRRAELESTGRRTLSGSLAAFGVRHASVWWYPLRERDGASTCAVATRQRRGG